jgi:hypothetical protein
MPSPAIPSPVVRAGGPKAEEKRKRDLRSKKPDYRNRNDDDLSRGAECAGNRYGKKVSSMSHAKTKNASACFRHIISDSPLGKPSI